MISNIVKFFRGLRGKLILTYTLVTVLALMALEALVIGVILLPSSLQSSDLGSYLSDVVYVLYPQAQNYLQPGQEDIAGLQSWLSSVYGSGRASLPPQNLFDSPAALIATSNPIFVLSPDGSVLAQSPLDSNSLVGRQFNFSNYSDSMKIMDAALKNDFTALDLYAHQPDGNYLVAIPVPQDARNSQLVGVIMVTVEPPPSRAVTYWPLIALFLLGTGMMLVLAVSPFGALFGFIMSRGLTRRLKTLTRAVDAWSNGDFSVQPQDRSQDEISYLSRRMRHMAERVQALLETRHELAMLEERNRLARELHDTVKQEAFATLMQVRAAKNLIGEDPQTARQHLDEAESLIKTSQQELGRMIAELRPAALEGKGLVDALRIYLETWSKNACIPADFQVQDERRLPLEIEQALYRVAQEALSNVARHSRASAVTVGLAFKDKQVILSVADNGVGFDLAAKKQGFGLQTMRERVATLGGQVAVKTAPGAGTILTVLIP